MGAVEAPQAGRRAPDGLRPRRRRLPVAARVPLRRAPGTAARRRRAAGLLPQRQPSRATASTTRARWRCCCGWAASRRAWRPGSAPAATRRARAPGSCATPTPTRGSRSGSTSSAGSRSIPTPDATPARSQVAALAPVAGATPVPAADTGAGDAAANTERPNLSLRPELQLGRGDATSAGSADSGFPFWGWVLCVLGGLALILAVLLFRRRPRGKTPMDRAIAEVEDALRRVGRPVTTGTTMTQLERRLGSHSPEVAAYLRALAAGRYGGFPGTAAADGTPRAAPRSRAGPGLRCADPRAVGAAAADRARPALTHAGRRDPRAGVTPSERARRAPRGRATRRRCAPRRA